MHIAIRALVLLSKVAGLFVIVGMGYQMAANYHAGRSGPFKGLDSSGSNANKHVKLEAQLGEYFASPRRVDLADSFMESLGFRCKFWTDEASKSRLGTNTNGTILVCIYKFEGIFYLIPDNLVVDVYFNNDLISYKFDYKIESV